MSNNSPPPPENLAVYEIMWGADIVESGRSQMTTWRRHIACWVTKATDTLSEYAICITYPHGNIGDATMPQHALPVWYHLLSACHTL